MRLIPPVLLGSAAWLLGLCLLLGGCSPGPGSQPSTTRDNSTAAVPVPVPSYIELGDLDAIGQHGLLRLIAPRFDGADALPREGIPIAQYQQLAEAFSQQLGLDVEWVFVDEFAELIPTLLRGEGDLIVTNMTVTLPRLEQVYFSRPINKVNELLITRQTDAIESPAQLDQLTLSVPSGTAYPETLEALAKEHDLQLKLTLAPSSTSDSELLSAIQAGDFQATVMDSDTAASLLLDYPELSAGPVLKKHRPIAWAVRKSSPKLLNRLNQFMVSHHLETSANKAQPRDWAQIKTRGRLRMLTLNNPASYFMWRGELMGFDLELMKKFAEQHQLHLSIIIKDDIDELINALINGEGDVIAASLTQSEDREALGLMFSHPYLKVSEQLVGRRDGPKINAIEELAAYRVGINPSTVYRERLLALKEQGIAPEVLYYPATSTEQLIDKLMAAEFDFTTSDSHLLAIESGHRDNLEINLELGNEANIAWALRPEQKQLEEQLNAFIKKQYRGLFYNITYNKYFKNSRRMRQHKAERISVDSSLSPFDELVKPLAQKYGMDWRLVIAQMYQESKFNPEAKSFAGAQGLMQVMPRTAHEMGFNNLTNPANSIAAGMAYLDWLEERFPGELDLQERIYFTLAAYNAGAGHVRDARRLARQQGLDPNRWFGEVEKAMLMLAKPEYYKTARFGYVRGSEPVQYVKKIRDRYLGYLQLN